MDTRTHLRITGSALKNWFVAQLYDALAVGMLWLVGLLIVGVPWAPLWAFLGIIFQFVPNLGPALTLLGPILAALLSNNSEKAIWVLCVYAVIVVVDGLVLQPYFMKRTTRVPIWASLLMPIALFFLLPVWWGVVLAAPILAIIYGYRAYHARLRAHSSPGNVSSNPASPPSSCPTTASSPAVNSTPDVVTPSHPPDILPPITPRT
jgi:predicted PurR-regulated permease PerM